MHHFSVLAYTLVIWVFQKLIVVISPFNLNAKKWLTGRKNHPFQASEINKKTIWFHVASLGEYEQGKPVMDALKMAYPNYPLAVSFFSPSGFDAINQKHEEDFIFYLPIDTPKNAKKFIQHLQPAMAVFVKYDLWYFYLKELKSKAVPTFLISADFRAQQIFFKTYGSLFREMIFCFDHIFLQQQSSVTLLNSINYKNTTLTGDTRVERVKAIAQSNFELPEIAAFKQNKKLIVFGSTWEEDEKLALAFIQQTADVYKHLQYIIVPHQIDEIAIHHFMKKLKIEAVLLSKYKNFENQSFRVLIVDKVGLLSKLYRYADMAYIGGGFQRGIHNILEAAVYQIPVVFGPVHQSFKEAVELKKIGAAQVVNSSQEWVRFFKKWHDDVDLQKQIQYQLKFYFDNIKSPSERIVKKIKDMIQ